MRKDSATQMLILTALSLSIGWGIRGNYGYEHGAMIAGALAAMAAVVLSGREDWLRRIGYFGAFSAVGWAFGGSMSYGHLLSFAHSGDPLNVLYGFMCLYIVGFLWAAPGGAGCALPAFLSREKLTEIVGPAAAFFAALCVHDVTYHAMNAWIGRMLGWKHVTANFDYRHTEPLYWYDGKWTTALLAIIVALIYARVRRKFDTGTSLILHLAIGWWVGFLLFPVLLQWRMTPPRNDNWAGCIGFVGGMLVWLQRNKLHGVTVASLIAGLVGGAGFAIATMLELLEVERGIDTNWHSVLEQTYGLINGIGIGLVMVYLLRRTPRVSDDPPIRRWTDWFCPSVVLLLITYLNSRKNVDDWINCWVKRNPAMTHLYFLVPISWFNIWYIAAAVATVWLMVAHMKRPLAIVPTTWLGKAQLLYLLFLWWMVIANFEKALSGFAEQRLITEGTIFLNALVCTVMVARCSWRVREAPAEEYTGYRAAVRRLAMIGPITAVLCIGLTFCVTHARWGSEVAKFRGKAKLRFGPHATSTDYLDPNKPFP
jgi:hypothetical protein